MPRTVVGHWFQVVHKSVSNLPQPFLLFGQTKTGNYVNFECVNGNQMWGVCKVHLFASYAAVNCINKKP